MINKIKNIGLIILAIAVILLSFKACDEKEVVEVEVPVKIEVPVPVVEKQFDTVYLPQPIKVIKETQIDSSIYNKYLTLKDSIAKNKIVKDALTIREYNETFEDSIQTINVYSEVTGTLNKQQLSYNTKPRTISVDTTVNAKVKIPYKTKFAIGGEVGIPLQGVQEIIQTPTQSIVIKQEYVGKANFYIDTKKIIYSGSFDTEKRVWIGLAYKF